MNSETSNVLLLQVQIAQLITLSSCVNLRVLHFRQVGPDVCTKLSLLFLLLAQVRSAVIRSLVFTLDIHILERLKEEEWLTLGRCLALPVYAGLDEVVFVIHYKTIALSEQFLRRRLSGTDARGILRFEFVPM